MKMLAENGPACTLNPHDVAEYFSVQLIGPAFNEADLLATLEKGDFICVRRRVLREWFEFLKKFGDPALYGDCPSVATTMTDGSASDPQLADRLIDADDRSTWYDRPAGESVPAAFEHRIITLGTSTIRKRGRQGSGYITSQHGERWKSHT